MTEAKDEIFPLWPTWIGQLQLPGAEAQNRALAGLASPGVAGNLFEHEHPAAAWLREWTGTAVSQWFERFRMQPAPQWRAFGRLEALGFGQYRELATRRELTYVEEKGAECHLYAHRRNHTVAVSRDAAAAAPIAAHAS